MTVAATDTAVPHDSAVPADAECTRVCNTHHPRHTQALTKPPRSGEAQPIRPQLREPPHRGPRPKHAPTHPVSNAL